MEKFAVGLLATIAIFVFMAFMIFAIKPSDGLSKQEAISAFNTLATGINNIGERLIAVEKKVGLEQKLPEPSPKAGEKK